MSSDTINAAPATGGASETPTPRTDAESFWVEGEGIVVQASVAADIEAQLAAANQRAEQRGRSLMEAQKMSEMFRSESRMYRERAYRAENVRWDNTIPPGGLVCATCRDPVESEPCPLHDPTLRAERAERERDMTQQTIDLWRDEFKRIRSCPGADSKIKQLCSRALDWSVQQRFSLIEQRDIAERERDELAAKLAAMDLDRKVELHRGQP